MSQLSRPRDKYYFYFLVSYLPLILCNEFPPPSPPPPYHCNTRLTFFRTSVIDTLPLYSPKFIPRILNDLHEWYKSYFNDQLAIAQPSWYIFYLLIEVGYQLPVGAWAAYQWGISDKPSTRVFPHMLLWSFLGVITTSTCIAHFYGNKLMTAQDKVVLSAMFGSYGLICEYLSLFLGLNGSC
jgi:hypothetical protein